MSALLAVVAALLFAVGTVLQERVASSQAESEALRAGFLARLARRPMWLAGIAADAGGFACQAAALGLGRIVVVQPLLTASLVFALPLGAWLTGRRVGRRDWVAAVLVTAALAAFLLVGDPSGGRDDATPAAWLASAAVVAAICAMLIRAARGRSPAARAALLGAAAGVLFGLSAALTKATVERLDEGLLGVLADWHLYALAVVGYASMVLSQASLQTGVLAPAVATQMALDPCASLVLGIAAFDERLHDTPAGTAGTLAAVAVLLGGLVALASPERAARSPAPAA